MPDGAPHATQGRQAAAIAALGAYLANLPGPPRPLAPSELLAYRARRAVAGWRLDVAFRDGVRRLDVVVDRDFPFALPLVILVDRPPPLTWPHIEEDGKLCLLPGAAESSPHDPVGVAQHVLGHASTLIEACIAGTNRDDFRTEFHSYWNRVQSLDATPFVSLVAPRPPSRRVWVWRGERFYLLADDEVTARAWLRNIAGKPKQPHTIEPAALLWLPRALLPCEYPMTAAEVLALARTKTADGAAILEAGAFSMPDRLAILLGAPTPYGPSLAGVTIVRRQANQWTSKRRGHDPMTRGFRPGRVPSKVRQARYFGATSILRSEVERIDAGWIHGRDQDKHQALLRAARIVGIGAGSVGAPIATRLAQAGAAEFDLIDPKRLKSANVGRHPLGVGHLGSFKAVALVTKIQRDYPHTRRIEAHPYRWQDLAEKKPDLLAAASIIVSAIGHWNDESALNAWHVDNGRRPAIIYCWLEPHASAGHAIAVMADGGCLQCGFSNVGVPHVRVTDWPAGSQLVHEPACGAVYQPYGPVELSSIESLVAELCLDVLLGKVSSSRHRIWAARTSFLEAAGGIWAPDWAKQPSFRAEGGYVEDRPWPAASACPVCGGRRSC